MKIFPFFFTFYGKLGKTGNFSRKIGNLENAQILRQQSSTRNNRYSRYNRNRAVAAIFRLF